MLLRGQQQQLCGQESAGIPCRQAAFSQGTSRYCWYLGYDRASKTSQWRQSQSLLLVALLSFCRRIVGGTGSLSGFREGAMCGTFPAKLFLKQPFLWFTAEPPEMWLPACDKARAGKSHGSAQGRVALGCCQRPGWRFRTLPALVRAGSKRTMLAEQSAGCLRGKRSGSGCYQKCGLPWWNSW